jgi:hypothetical protein
MPLKRWLVFYRHGTGALNDFHSFVAKISKYQFFYSSTSIEKLTQKYNILHFNMLVKRINLQYIREKKRNQSNNFKSSICLYLHISKPPVTKLT